MNAVLFASSCRPSEKPVDGRPVVRGQHQQPVFLRMRLAALRHGRCDLAERGVGGLQGAVVFRADALGAHHGAGIAQIGDDEVCRARADAGRGAVDDARVVGAQAQAFDGTTRRLRCEQGRERLLAGHAGRCVAWHGVLRQQREHAGCRELGRSIVLDRVAIGPGAGEHRRPAGFAQRGLLPGAAHDAAGIGRHQREAGEVRRLALLHQRLQAAQLHAADADEHGLLHRRRGFRRGAGGRGRRRIGGRRGRHGPEGARPIRRPAAAPGEDRGHERTACPLHESGSSHFSVFRADAIHGDQ
jgi:hypothetical protein